MQGWIFGPEGVSGGIWGCVRDQRGEGVHDGVDVGLVDAE